MPYSPESFRKKLLFSALYFSEGAPIGYLWWAMPVRLRSAEVSLEDIGAFMAMLVLPWTFKFLWAPAVDSLQSRRWTLKHWIVAAQLAMGLTLVPLFWLDLKVDFDFVKWLLVAHAVCAATQDVSIDALCISITRHEPRGQYNGWMQAGMLAGRSLLGGGALVLIARFGDTFAIAALLAATLFSMVLLFVIPEVRSLHAPEAKSSIRESFHSMLQTLRYAFSHTTMWFGILFGLTGGAAYEALGTVQGPLMSDLGYSEEQIGWVFAFPNVAAMALGSVIGGYIVDRIGHRIFVPVSLALFVLGCATAGVVLLGHGGDAVETVGIRAHVFAASICLTSFNVGLFVASSYSLFMDLVNPKLASTQFSTFMGATNGCEAWSAKTIGILAATQGPSIGLWIMCLVSLLSTIMLVPMLRALRRAQAQDAAALPS